MVMILHAVTASASTVIYQFEPVSPGLPVGGQIPWVEATFQDTDPGKVLLTISTANLGGGEFLGDLYFNFDPAENVNRLLFARRYNLPGPLFSVVSTGDNSFKLAGYGDYDIQVAFSGIIRGKSSGARCVSYLISEPGLDALDFVFAAPFGTAGSYDALARIQGVCGNSFWLGCSAASLQPVPEPAALGLLSLTAGLACALWHGKKQRDRGTECPSDGPRRHFSRAGE